MQRKNQNAIMQKLYQYLLRQNRHERYLDKLPHSGYCYAISLVRSAMRVIGKLLWWEDALDMILAWDGRADSLKQSYILKDADEGRLITLETIFDRAINYIVFNQASQAKYPYVKYSQYSFLRPDGFFLLQKKDEVLRIKQHYSIAGYLTQNQLVKILNDSSTRQAINTNICLICSFDHVCELGYQDGSWQFFDPNYSDGKSKSFNKLTRLASEVSRNLGNNISIQLACMSKLKVQPFAYYYDELLAKHPEILIQDQGLSIIADSSTELISKLLSNLKHTNKLACLNLNSVGSENWMPLMYAVQNDHVDAIYALCKAGALPNQAHLSGWTPLMFAAQNGYVGAIKALCEAGALPNQAKQDGWTALMSAVKKGHTDAVKMLCQAGALPNQPKSNGWTPLMYAAKKGYSETIKVLVDHGALPNQAMPDGWTPLMSAAAKGRVDAIKVLCEIGALPDKGLIDSMMTPLMITAQYGHLDAVSQLLLNQADPGLTMSTDVSYILELAKIKDHKKEMQAFIKQQHKGLLTQNIAGLTALDLAVFFGQRAIVKVLLGKMPNLNSKKLDKLYNLAQAMHHNDIINDLKHRKNKKMKENENRQVQAILATNPFRLMTSNRTLYSAKSYKYRR